MPHTELINIKYCQNTPLLFECVQLGNNEIADIPQNSYHWVALEDGVPAGQYKRGHDYNIPIFINYHHVCTIDSIN